MMIKLVVCVDHEKALDTQMRWYKEVTGKSANLYGSDGDQYLATEEVAIMNTLDTANVERTLSYGTEVIYEDAEYLIVDSLEDLPSREEYFEKCIEIYRNEYGIKSITKYKDEKDTYIMHSKKATIIFLAKRTESGGYYSKVLKARNHESQRREYAERYLFKYISLVREIGYFTVMYGADDEN
jgi:hypothetical protein